MGALGSARFALHLLLLLAQGAVLLQWSGSYALVAHHRHRHHPTAKSISNEVESEAERQLDSENKLMIECQNEDYRAYIKCLKRDKRQWPDNDSVGNMVYPDTQHNCLNECFNQNCTSSLCIRDCHKRCRTRLTVTKTLETTIECSNDKCSNSNGAAVPNVTTNIHIDNILPNSTGSNLPRIEIHNEIKNNLGSGTTAEVAGASWPPWPPLPQITIGFGGGGCVYPTWPCYPRYPVSQQAAPPSVDCSMCLVYHYPCNPGCVPGANVTTTTDAYKPPLPSRPASNNNWRGT